MSEKLITLDQMVARPRKKTWQEAYIPPCSEKCEAFARGNCMLDPGTQERLIGEPRTPEHEPTKTVLVFLGMPGAGKTTQIHNVVEATGAPVYHMGNFAKRVSENNPELQEQIKERRLKGELITNLDEPFLAEVDNDPSDTVILDGFPRSVSQLSTLQEQALRQGWNVKVVYVAFPDDEQTSVELSLDRQRSRHIAEGKEITEEDEARFQGKVARALREDMSVVATLSDAEVPVITLNGAEDLAAAEEKIREDLGLSFETLPFNTETLSQLAEVADRLGIEAWASSGSVYRPFWNDTYGPVQESTDIDAWADTPEQADQLRKALEEAYPTVRWAVESWQQHYKKAYGVPTEGGFVDSLDRRVLSCRQGACRLHEGKLEIKLGKGAEADLRAGVLRIDEEALAQLPNDQRQYHIDKTVASVAKMIQEYPGLKIEDPLADLFEMKYGYRHEPLDITKKWNELNEGVWKSEQGGRAHWDPESLTPMEKAYAQDVVNFFRSAKKVSSAPPRPDKAPLPGSLEAMRLSGDNSEVPAPEGYSGWLHFVAQHAPDAEFREWLLNQTRSRTPIGGKDSTIQEVFSFQQFEAFTRNDSKGGEQKLTHQGWTLDMHLRETMFQVETDELLEGDLGEYTPEEARLGMRLALLYHDVGKLKNVNTPGCHEGIGAKMFLACRPSWIPEKVATLSAQLIRLHDVFGRLSRGICEKDGMKMSDPNFDVAAQPSYTGALDPKHVREEISQITDLGIPFPVAVSMVKAVWEADVSSVASLRWLLPIADKLELLILAKDGALASLNEQLSHENSIPLIHE